MRVAVTGAFGYSGKYIAKRLLAQGHELWTQTDSVRRAKPLAGAIAHDVIITREVIQGLMANRLYAHAPPMDWTRLSEWVAEHAANLRRRSTSELRRRIDQASRYASNQTIAGPDSCVRRVDFRL